MDLRKLKKLIDLVEESGISELELTEDGEKVRISRNFTASAPMQHYAPAQYAAAPQAAPQLRPPLLRLLKKKAMLLSHLW